MESALPRCRSCKPACTETAASCLKGKNEAQEDLDNVSVRMKKFSLRLSRREGSACSIISVSTEGNPFYLAHSKGCITPDDRIYAKRIGRICVGSETAVVKRRCKYHHTALCSFCVRASCTEWEGYQAEFMERRKETVSRATQTEDIRGSALRALQQTDSPPPKIPHTISAPQNSTPNKERLLQTHRKSESPQL